MKKTTRNKEVRKFIGCKINIKNLYLLVLAKTGKEREREEEEKENEKGEGEKFSIILNTSNSSIFKSYCNGGRTKRQE